MCEVRWHGKRSLHRLSHGAIILAIVLKKAKQLQCAHRRQIPTGSMSSAAASAVAAIYERCFSQHNVDVSRSSSGQSQTSMEGKSGEVT